MEPFVGGGGGGGDGCDGGDGDATMNHHRLVDAADDVVKYITSHILFQILLRLPVRLLLRFRCVCKEWCELIDSRVFKDAYLALRRRRATEVGYDQLVGLRTALVSNIPQEDMDRVLAIEDPNDEQFRTLRDDISRQIYSISLTCWSSCDHQFLPPPSSSSSLCNDDFEISGNCSGRFRIINHFDGIVCLLNGPNWFDITLANPALREIRKLPIPLFDLGGFKPWVDGIGFGYDDSSNEYKVVAIVTVFEQEDAYVSPYKHIGIVYRLSTDSWTMLGDMSEFVSCPFISIHHVESIFSHGSLHWFIQLPCDVGQEEEYRILAFDVTSESFREMPFPDGYRYYAPYDCDAMDPHLLLVDKSTVALVANTVINCRYDQQVVDVWVMKEYGDNNSWSKQCSITVLPGLTLSEPICIWKKDKILLNSLSADSICYDLLTGQRLMDEQVYPVSVCGIRPLQLVTGHESFVSVKLV